VKLKKAGDMLKYISGFPNSILLLSATQGFFLCAEAAAFSSSRRFLPPLQTGFISSGMSLDQAAWQLYQFREF